MKIITMDFINRVNEFLYDIERVTSYHHLNLQQFIKINNQLNNIIAHIDKYRVQYCEECMYCLRVNRKICNNILISLELYGYKKLNENCINLHKYCTYTCDRLFSKEELKYISSDISILEDTIKNGGIK